MRHCETLRLFQRFTNLFRCQVSPLRSQDSKYADGTPIDDKNHAEYPGTPAEVELAQLDADFPMFPSQRTTIGTLIESLKRLLKSIQPLQSLDRSARFSFLIDRLQVLPGKSLNSDLIIHWLVSDEREVRSDENASAKARPSSPARHSSTAA